jgi:hypothetical protein
MLTLMSPCDGLVGLKLPPSSCKSLQVDDIVYRIVRKEAVQLWPEVGTMKGRIAKMKGRGWSILPKLDIYQPAREEDTLHSSLVRVYGDDHKYAKFFDELRALGGRNITGYRIQNQTQSTIYEAIKGRIADENNGQANERKLWHGTTAENAQNIIKSGFDDRYWNGGNGAAFGRAAYFGGAARMSHDFSSKDAKGSERWIFRCRVALGNCETLSQPDSKYFPKPPYHSSKCERSSWHPGITQFMTYRYGQAIPDVIFRYTV